jgi:uncharacterized membrane protein YeaQ/YmgE (transglycosylase-associated protein family)
MLLFVWVIVGVVAGLVARKVVGGKGEGVVMQIIIGTVGAVIGGWLFAALGMVAVAQFNLSSLLAAFVGAALLLVAYHAVSHGVC